MKIYQRYMLALFPIALLCLFPGGCTGKRQARAALTLAVVIQAGSNQFFESIEKGMRAAAQKQNVRLLVITDKEHREPGQQKLAERLITQNVRGLLLMPEAREDSKKYSIPLILEANRHHIPVVFIHAAIDEELMKSAGAQAMGLVTNDKRMSSTLAAEYIVKKLEGKGTILVMEGGAGGQRTENSRLEGFLEVTNKYPLVSVLYTPPGKWRRQDAFLSACEALKIHRSPDAMFTYSETMLLGILDAVDSMKIKKPLIAGFNGTDEGKNLLKTGRIDALIDQKPYEMGKAGIEYMVRLLRGEQQPEVYMIKTSLITKESFLVPFH